MKQIEQKVIKFIDEKKLINRNDKILVAFSGGPDSVFLLNFLVKFQKKYKISIGALHVNHRLRGTEAMQDEQFCRSTCKTLKVKYFSVKKNVKSHSRKYKYSLEESGRILRYYELNRFAVKHHYNKIATAHNSSDNTETVLLNLIKGAGLKGISGIPYKRGNIIRPVLCLTKEDIISYLNYLKLGYRTDSSNLSNDYERNFLRNEILIPVKKRMNPSLEDAILKSSEIFRNADYLIERKVEEVIDSAIEFSEDKLAINLNETSVIEPELIPELIKTSLQRNFLIQVTFNDISKIKSLFEQESGKKVCLSSNLTAIRERDTILISENRNEEEFFPLEIEHGEEVKVNGKTFSIKLQEISVQFSDNKMVEYVSADGLNDKFILRRWMSGDRFYPIGLKGTKKVSDFLNEQKIPASQKKKQLVLTNRGKIVWVLGLRLDDRFKITNKTNRVYKLCLIQKTMSRTKL